MRELKKLNPNESISKRKLIFDEGWSDKFNRLTVYLMFAPFIFLPIVTFLNEKSTNSNETFMFYFVFPISILLGIYMYYRNATEKNLSQLNTQLDRETIRKLLLNYAEKSNFEIYRKSNDCLIFNESFDSSSYKKTRIFFIQDNIVLFTIIRDNFKINLPILFTHFFMKHDLNKLIKKGSI